jgi:acetyl esterase/lipase
VIAGDSSGGGLAIATSLALRDQGLPPPAGVAAISPWSDLAFGGSTLDTIADLDLTATVAGLRQMAERYLAGFDPRTPLTSPVYADLAGLPPMLMVAGGHEILLDDSLRLAKNAALAQVDVTLRVVPCMQHVFPLYVGSMPEADAAVAFIGRWIAGRLS